MLLSPFRPARTAVFRLPLRLALAALLLSPATLPAARVPVAYRVEAGFGGFVREEGGIFPVCLTIENKVAGTAGVLEICQPDHSGKFEVRQSLPIVTPAPSVKRFVLLARIEPDRDLEIRVSFQDHLRPIRETLKLKRSPKPLVLCLGLSPALSFGRTADEYRFVHVGPDALPADPVALDGVHAVVLSGPAFAGLGREHVSALRQWTETGGTLILHEPVSGGAAAGNTRDLIRNSGLDLARRGAFRLGAGVLASSGTNSTNPAFWDGDSALSGRLFPAAAPEAEGHFRSSSHLLSSLWRTQQSHGPIGFLWVLVIIAAYLCTIGPLDRWLVKRYRKPYLTWVFFPAAIAAFSALAYGYTSLTNVGTMRAVYVNVGDTAAGSETVRGNAFFWVYSAKNATYTLGSPVENVVFSGRQTSVSAGAMAAVNVFTGRNSTISARIPVFSAKEFDAAWYAEWKQPVACRQIGSNWQFTPPKGVKIKAAFLAEEQGVRRFKLEDDTWASDSLTDWGPMMNSLSQRLEKSLHQSWQGGLWADPEHSGMPAEDTFQDYLVLLSFPWPAATEPQKSWPDGAQERLLRQRSTREKALDIRHRLKTGKVLLLFMDAEQDLLRMKIEKHSPETARVNLVRVQLPGQL